MKFTTMSVLLLTSILCSCDMIEHHPYDCKIEGATDLTEKNIAEIESQSYGDTLRFVVISDTQRWYDDLEDGVRAINRLDNISFIIHCGDLSDFGTTDEFMWQRDIMQRLKKPYVCLIGNHDMLGTGEYVFNSIFGDYDFSFTAGKTHFVCLNTNALEKHELSHIPNFNFLKDELYNIDDSIEQTIVAMHAQPGSEQFNNDVKERFHNTIKRFPNLRFCLSGHGHSLRDKELFNDGTRYIMCPCIHRREFLIFTVTDNSFYYERIEF